MNNTLTSNQPQFSGDNEIWYNLKCAIAASSGFRRWLYDGDIQLHNMPLEEQVQRYLRETLEALAY